MKNLTYVLLFFVFIGTSENIAQTAIVTKVHDGDSFTAKLGSGKTITCRLWGVDAPEMYPFQAYGMDSRNNLKMYILNKEVRLKVIKYDTVYHRYIVSVYAARGRVDSLMVATGNVWYIKYMKTIVNGEKLMANAKANKLGLWADPKPVAPWVYRHYKRKMIKPKLTKKISEKPFSCCDGIE